MKAGITIRLLLAVILLGGMLLPNSASADPRAWSKFVMTNGDRVLCVVVRVDSRGNFLVITESGDEPLRLAKRDIQTPGALSPAAAEVNVLLNIIEQRMVEQDFDRVRRNMPELQKAMKQFETFLQPVIRSTYEGDAANKKAAIKAVKYYQDTTAQFGPTITTFGICNEIKVLDKQLANGQEKYSADVLQKFIVLEIKIADINVPTPLAKRAKDEADQVLERHLKAIGGELREVAIGRLEGLQQTAPVIAFVKELKTGDGVDQRYANELELTIRELPPILKTYRDDVPPAVDAILSLAADLNATQKKFKQKVEVVEAMTAMLQQIKPFMYGETKAKMLALIDKELKANSDLLASVNERRDLILSIRERFRSAELALSRSQFDEALQLYRRAQTDVQAAQLPGEEINTRIQQGMQRVRILQFIHSVEQADKLEDAHIDVLIKNGQRLILNGEEQLEGTGVTIGNLQKSVIRLQNYQRFRTGFTKIKGEVANDSLKAWATIARMNSWIEDNKGSLLASAIEEWDQFSKAELQTVLAGATEQILSSDASVSDDERVERLREFAGYAFTRTGPDAAAVMISRGLKASNREPYKKAIAKLVQELVDKAVTNGDSDAALQFFQKVVETEPSIQQILGDKDMLVLLRLTKAQKMEADKPLEALAIYDEICKASPALAERRGVFQKALNIRLREAADAIKSDPASALSQYNGICELYGKYCKDNELIAAAGQTLVDEIIKLWDDGKFTEVVEAVQRNSEAYPALMQATDAQTLIFQTLYRRANGMQAQAIRGEKPVAKVTIEALSLLYQKYPEVSTKFRLDAIMMEMQLHMASLFLANNQTDKAMAVYEKALADYPELSESYYVSRKMDGIVWRYRLEKVQRPLSITTYQDSLAFLFLLLFWPLIVSRTAYQGRTNGHRGYRFQHLGVVFGIFLLLMCFFVYGLR
jgi:tetratricopeptide (TPR) repeat protein